MQQKMIAFAKGNLLIIAFVILGLVAYVASMDKVDEPVTSFIPEPKSVDTFIPKGHVLIPIEISNADSLSSLIGDLGGVVDLYLASGEAKRQGVRVGTKLKLMRAPLNHQQYAVLVKDHGSNPLPGLPGPFIAVVQNPDTNGAEITEIQHKTLNQVRVDYQN